MASSTDVKALATASRFRPRFTLAALLALVTLSALGAWYWWRVPFEVETTTLRRGRQVETVRRVWGGKTLRHGPLREFDASGHKIAEIQYREGLLHGPSMWFDSQERLTLTLQFERGRLVGPVPLDVDSGIGRRLIDGEIANGPLIQALVRIAPIEFLETPLTDALEFLEAQQGVPLEIDVRGLETNGINIDSPVSLTVERMPLMVTLCRVLKPLNLVCDYRFGTLFITTPERFEAGDQTGVEEIKPPMDSLLAEVWDAPVDAEFLETPLSSALAYLSEQNKGRTRFDLSHLPEPYKNAPITRTLNLPLRHVIGAILDDLDLRCELRDETIVLKVREP